MFFLGVAAGAAEKGQENYARIREKTARQLEEAKAYAEKAKAREAQAAEVRAQIGNANKSYGINEQILLSAYKDGNLDTYLKGIESARERAALNGTQLSPEILESYYSVPRSRYEGRDVDAELSKIFGVIQQGIDNQEEIDDVTLSDIIVSALGGDDEGAVRRRNRGETVQGYGVDKLLNMSSVGPVEGDGGTFSDEFYQDVNRRPPKSGGDGGAHLTEGQMVDKIVEQGMGQIQGRGAWTQNTAIQGLIESALSMAAVPFVLDQYNQGSYSLTVTPEIISRALKQHGDSIYILAGKNEDGENLWSVIDPNTAATTGQITDTELKEAMGTGYGPEVGPTGLEAQDEEVETSEEPTYEEDTDFNLDTYRLPSGGSVVYRP